MDIRATRLALADALQEQGYHVYDTVPADPELPAAVVMAPVEVRFNQTLSGTVEADFQVIVAQSRNDDTNAQELLDQAMSWPGLAKPIQTYQTPAWRSCVVQSANNVRDLDVGNGRKALAFDINITTLGR